MIRALTAVMLVAISTAASGQRQQLVPVDQCIEDSSFAAFRADLLGAIARRDAAFVLSVVADDIRVDLGGGAGREEFRRAWQLDRPETSELWHELGTVLGLGCMQAGDEAWAPSLFRQLEYYDDPTGVVVAIGAGISLRSAPSETSDVVERLDWDVLVWRPVDSPEGWLPVGLADGRPGFIRRDQARSLLDHRATFARTRGRWRMTAFIAGD